MRLQALDLLRFFAAIAVVLYHYTARPDQNSFPQLTQITQFGYLGVPLFFMISGFVIAASAERRTPIQFLISRTARLYPAFWIGIFFTATILWLFSSRPVGISQLLINLTMLNDYLGIANIDGVYWTLQVELKFYACIFLLLACGLLNRYTLWLPLWLVLTLTNIFFDQPAKMGWFINPGYSPYFISGVCFHLLWSRKLSSISLATLCVSTLLCLHQSYWQAQGFMPLSNPTDWFWASLLVTLFHGIFFLLARHKLELKAHTIYPLLGGLTYPLYLIHNAAGKTIIDQLNHTMNEWMSISITIFGMLVLSFIIYRFIEPQGAVVVRESLNRLFLQRPARASHTTD